MKKYQRRLGAAALAALTPISVGADFAYSNETFRSLNDNSIVMLDSETGEPSDYKYVTDPSNKNLWYFDADNSGTKTEKDVPMSNAFNSAVIRSRISPNAPISINRPQDSSEVIKFDYFSKARDETNEFTLWSDGTATMGDADKGEHVYRYVSGGWVYDADNSGTYTTGDAPMSAEFNELFTQKIVGALVEERDANVELRNRLGQAGSPITQTITQSITTPTSTIDREAIEREIASELGEQYTSQIFQLNRDLQSKTRDYDELVERMENNPSNPADSNKIRELELEIVGLNTDIAEAYATAEAAENSEEALSIKLGIAERAYNTLRDDRSGTTSAADLEKITSLENDMVELQVDYTNALRNATEAEASEARVQALYDTLLASPSELTDAQRTQITTLTEKISALDAQIEAYETADTAQTTQITSLERQVSTQESTIATRDARVTSLENTVATKDGVIEILETDIATAMANLTTAESNYAEVQEKYNALLDAPGSLEEAQLQEMERLREEVAGYETHVEELQLDLVELQSEYDTLLASQAKPTITEITEDPATEIESGRLGPDGNLLPSEQPGVTTSAESEGSATADSETELTSNKNPWNWKVGVGVEGFSIFNTEGAPNPIFGGGPAISLGSDYVGITLAGLFGAAPDMMLSNLTTAPLSNGIYGVGSVEQQSLMSYGGAADLSLGIRPIKGIIGVGVTHNRWTEAIIENLYNGDGSPRTVEPVNYNPNNSTSPSIRFGLEALLGKTKIALIAGLTPNQKKISLGARASW